MFCPCNWWFHPPSWRAPSPPVGSWSWPTSSRLPWFLANAAAWPMTLANFWNSFMLLNHAGGGGCCCRPRLWPPLRNCWSKCYTAPSRLVLGIHSVQPVHCTAQLLQWTFPVLHPSQHDAAAEICALAHRRGCIAVAGGCFCSSCSCPKLWCGQAPGWWGPGRSWRCFRILCQRKPRWIASWG